MLAEQADEPGLLVCGSNHHRRRPVGLDRVRVRPGRDQRFGSNHVATLHRPGQRRAAQLVDDIDLGTIDAQSGGGNQKFKWIGKQGFHDKKGELHYVDKGSTVIVQGDTNGDGKADFEIFMKAGALSKGDFLL